MIGETSICLGNELLVKPLLVPAGFVAGNEQNRLSAGIEGEGGAPLAIRGLESQLLHIGVLRSLERIGVGSPKLRAIVRKQLGHGEQRILDILLEGQKLDLESILEFDVPSHEYSF